MPCHLSGVQNNVLVRHFTSHKVITSLPESIAPLSMPPVWPRYEGERVMAPALEEPAVYWEQQTDGLKWPLNGTAHIEVHTAFSEKHVRECPTTLES